MTAGVETMSFGLSPDIIEKMRGVFADYPEIEQVVVYGSRALGKHRNASDIDLTLMGDGLAWSHLQRIETELDDLLLPWKIDISLFQQIDNPDLIAHIQRVGKVLYKR